MKLLKIFSIIALMVGLLNADPINLNGSKNGFDINMQTQKSLVVGNNTFYVTLSKNGEAVTDAKVKAKFFMPEMPGMPYMEYVGKAKLVDGKYKMNINLSMSGTWQYHLMFKTADGKVHKIRSSVNL